MPKQKDVLTTGEVAKICNVAPRTVSKWFDSGQLKGYRIPGSKDRRIPVSALIRFMKQHSIPLDGLMSGQTRVLIVDSDPELATAIHNQLGEKANYEVQIASGGFAAGVACEKFRPHCLLLDIHLPDTDCKGLVRSIRESGELQLTRIVATSGKLTDGQLNALLKEGFDGFMKKPFGTREAIEAIEDAVALVY